MLVQAKKIVVLSLMVLATAVISRPSASFSATSPTVSVLSPLTNGIRTPVKIALDAEGSIYVADQRVGGIVRFNTYGVQQPTIRTAATPNGLAFAQDGSLLVSQGAFVARYDVTTGVETGRLTGGQLLLPSGIAVDDVTGYIYVADSLANQIEMYTASGSYVKAFGKGVRADANGASVLNPPGKLSMPTGISFEKVSRQIVVADTLSSRVQFFDTDGNFVKIVGKPVSTSDTAPATVPMQFLLPTAVAFEYSKTIPLVLKRIYVVESYNANVQVVDPDTLSAIPVLGATTNYIGSSGIANGQLMAPNDAVFDGVNNRLFVVNGFGNITAYGIDGGKNPVYVDVTPPVFTINPLPAELTVNALTISGTVEAGSSVQVVAGTSVQVGPVVTSGSNWSVQVAGLTLGDNPFTVTAKDVSGNVAISQVVSVKYLLPAPSVTIAPISVANSTTITLTGTVDAGSDVEVTNKTNAFTAKAVVTDTTWSCVVNLVEGMNSLSVSARKSQSAASVVTATVMLDSLAPSLYVSALTNGSYTSKPVQDVSGTVSDTTVVTVTVNGEPAVLNKNSFSSSVTLLNGSNLISVVAVDAAGNTTADSRTINFDVTKPYISILSPVDNSYTANTMLVISGTVDKTSAITVQGKTAIVDGNNWSATVELLAGVNTIEIAATDLYGNSSSAKRSITLDVSSPALAITFPAETVAVKVPNILIEGTVSDLTALTLDCTVNSSTVSVPVIDGVFSVNVDFTAEGTYPVTLTAKDEAGNSSTVVRNVKYDTTPPAFTLNQVVGVMPEKLSGTVEAGSSIVIKAVMDKEIPEAIGTIFVADGSWAADLTGVAYLPETLLAVATDAAGNSTSKTLTYVFPNGTLNADGKPTVQDALRAIRIVVNNVAPSVLELAHYDIGPLVGGKPNPNGKIGIDDAILILRKALGLKSW